MPAPDDAGDEVRMEKVRTSKREMAVGFLSLASSGRVREAYERFVAAGFRHHNPYFAGDRASLMKGMEETAARNPDKSFEVKITLEDGDLVAAYSNVKMATADIAVVHIFRFERGKIAELWDVGQQVPADMKNENGMF